MASGSRPSWSRPAQGGSLGADVVPMACGSRAGSARVQTEPGLAARPCRLRFRWRQVSTALTLPSPTSEPPTGIVGMPRFVFGARHRSGVDVSTMDTSDPPRRARSRPSAHRRPRTTSPTPPGGYFCLGQAASACLSASLGVTVPVAHRLSPTHRALLPTPTGMESEASISTVV